MPTLAGNVRLKIFLNSWLRRNPSTILLKRLIGGFDLGSAEVSKDGLARNLNNTSRR